MAQTFPLTAIGRQIDWKAALWAAIIAGAVFMMMEMILVAVTGMGGMWGPPRMMAAMVLGKDVLPPPASFDLGIMMVAMVIHFMLSIVYAFILAWIIADWGMGTAVLAGGLFGLALYVINFYGFASVLFPWFAEARNWISILSHLVYGAVLAWSYKAIAKSGDEWRVQAQD